MLDYVGRSKTRRCSWAPVLFTKYQVFFSHFPKAKKKDAKIKLFQAAVVRKKNGTDVRRKARRTT